MLRQNKNAPANTAVNWLLGVSGSYLLVMTLWLPLAEFDMSFRHLTSLRQALPAGYNCIASHGLQEVERAMVHYWAGVKTRRLELGGPADCDLLLVQGDVRTPEGRTAPAGPWIQIWQNVHSQKALFRLYRKATDQDSISPPR